MKRAKESLRLLSYFIVEIIGTKFHMLTCRMATPVMLLSFLLASFSTTGQTTIVNYDFNAGASYAALTPALAAGVTCTVTGTEAFSTGTGTASGGAAFTANAVAGNALRMADSRGTNTRYWTFHINNTSATAGLKEGYKVYLQAKRGNAGAQTITIDYSTDGTNWTTFPTQFTNIGTTWSQSADFFGVLIFDFSSIAELNCQEDVYFRVKASNPAFCVFGCNYEFFIDNFQVQTGNGLATTNSLTLSSPVAKCLATYTYTYPNMPIGTDVEVTVTFHAGTDATTMTGGLFGGIPINMATVTTTPTQVTFRTPITPPLDCPSVLEFSLDDITNPNYDGFAVSNVSFISTVPAFTSVDFDYQITQPISFFDYTSIDYGTADGALKCWNGLTAGKTYCYTFIYPSDGGELQMAYIFNNCASCGNSTHSLQINDSDLPTCYQMPSAPPACYNFQLFRRCEYINDRFQAGFGCMVAGELYIVCFTVPSGCPGANLCPQIGCQNNADCHLGGGDVTLGVELIDFTAVLQNGIVNLNWVTTNEVNNSYFTVERTTDGRIYEPVFKTAGAGNSNQLIRYSGNDFNPLSGVSYYRLKQTDFDGVSTYSKPVAVEHKMDAPLLNIYPNPVGKNGFRVDVSGLGNNEVTILIRDAMGRIIHSVENSVKRDQVFSTNIGTEALAAGVYFVVVNSENTTITKKVIIQ